MMSTATGCRSDPPTTAVVAGWLAEASGLSRDEVEIEDRRCLEAGTSEKEIITARSPFGMQRYLFKHGAHSETHERSRRRGTSFEAAVYRQVVARTRLEAPRFVGSFTRADGGTTLVLEYLEDGVRLSEAPVDAMAMASAWLGRFHAEWTDRVPSDIDLHTHDAAQLRRWAERAVRYSHPLHREYPWVPHICERVLELADQLVAGPRCVLHGEFTVHNVLVRDGRVFPVDWEGSALGLGEIDFAMLIENWPPQIAADCTDAYLRARRPGSRPEPEHLQQIVRGQLYVTLRWLGDRPALAKRDSTRWRYHDLLAHASRSGVT